MNYALIENGIVTNVIWLHPGNASDFSNAVAMGDIPAEIGDSYTDGAFYRNGERVLTVAEQIAAAAKAARIAIAEAQAAETAYTEGVQMA